MNTIIIIILVLVVALLGYFLFFNKATDEDIQALIDTANKTGADTFHGVSFEKAKAKFSRLTKAEITKLTALYRKQESAWSESDQKQFKQLFQKATGKKLTS